MDGSQGEVAPAPGAWDHAAFLRVAWSALRERSFDDGIRRIREHLSPAAAHATLCLAWARLVDAALAGPGGGDLAEFLAAHPRLSDPDLVHQHYSPERIQSERARREFVLPDRLPLPARSDARFARALRDEGTKSVSSP